MIHVAFMKPIGWRVMSYLYDMKTGLMLHVYKKVSNVFRSLNCHPEHPSKTFCLVSLSSSLPSQND